MELNDCLRLSYYREIASINSRHAVKLVQHTETGKIYVMKCLRIYDRAVYERLRSVRPAGVPRIYELIEADEGLYVIEEYISGRSVRELLEEDGSLPESRAIEIVGKTCAVLSFLHRQTPPIVHRDIKPENLILDERGQLFLVDFNSAKECDGDKQRDTVLFGTAGYAAPEQYGFGESTPSADIYALGVLLRVLLTGDIENGSVSDRRLRSVIGRCTRIDPAERYESVEAVLNTIQGRKRRLSEESLHLPGLRSKKPFVIALSAMWYAIIVFASAVLTVEDATTFVIWGNRICCFLLFFSETLWLGNYRNIWQRVPLCRSKNKGLRIFGIILWAVVLLFVILEMMVAIG